MNVLAAVLLATLTIAIWALQHPYAGIYHDAQLYTLQALARVNPSGLSQDVFLRYGSQDSFTCFGALYAVMIGMLGAAPAAALLTFLSHLAFAAALLLLARCLVPGRVAWISAGLVCAVPLTYGAHKVFYVMEDFVTPRLLAQSLVLAGLAALLTRRYKLALLAGVVAALLHPVMALTGFLVGISLDTVQRRWRLGLLAAAGLLAVALAGWLATRGTPLRFDDEWWPIVHDGLPYLFPLEWRKFDWARVIVLASFLYSGMRHLPEGRARMLCRTTLVVTGLALAFNFLGADLLRVVIVTQLQFWRVLWLASAIALMVTPLVAPALWRSGAAGRITLIATLCAFLLADERFAMSSALMAAAASLLAERLSRDSPVLRPVLWGLFALLALSLVINVASSAVVARAGIDQSAVPDWMRALRSPSATGVLPALLLFATGWWVTRAKPVTLAAVAVVSLSVAVWVASAASAQWLQSPFSASARTAFTTWRERIPPGAEVLWFTSPVAVWVLLDRPSFVSVQQAASSLFSRNAAMVLRDRMAAVPEFLHSADSRPWEPGTGQESEGAGNLADACGATHADFVVSRKELATAPLATADTSLSPALLGWKLYACRDSTETSPASQ